MFTALSYAALPDDNGRREGLNKKCTELNNKCARVKIKEQKAVRWINRIFWDSEKRHIRGVVGSRLNVQ